MTLVPVPIFSAAEAIDIPGAISTHGISRDTLKRLDAQYRIFIRSNAGAKIFMNKVALFFAKNGDPEALEAIRAGDYEHPRVVNAYRVMGIKKPTDF
ncbi:hypothetical protein P6U16_08760 [Rhizobium sp. 32-5/1]|uniref:hypothetical protein n=1 Tax=Rhizobium sp. 32-5/1 TaxID=3019602 RepID=UPI00240D473C|nr:hypothetical protein [Rhizobium sp. 32-5/1]WEZ84646.1 hypothetical protein P6U16_08760 [Rhizobium sp. 32-5/1]